MKKFLAFVCSVLLLCSAGLSACFATGGSSSGSGSSFNSESGSTATGSSEGSSNSSSEGSSNSSGENSGSNSDDNDSSDNGGGSEEVVIVDRGCLKIEDVEVNVNESASIDLVFSKPEGVSAVSYSFAGNNIRIEGNQVTGLVGDTVTVVTATTEYHTETFKVAVYETERGEMSVFLPIGNTEDEVNTLYANYSARPLYASFSRPQYAEPVSFAVEEAYQDRVKITDGNMIQATGDFSTPAQVKITATSKGMSATTTITVKDFNGKNHVGNSLGIEAKVQSRLQRWNSYGAQKGGVVFMGDSFFDTDFWSNFYTMFARKNATTMGISSSTTTDWEYAVERLVYPLEPKAVVIHCGTNNIFDDHKTVAEVVAEVKKLFDMIHENLPNTHIYYFGIEPRVNMDNSAPKAANPLISQYCSEKGWLTYLDSPAWCYDNSGNVISSFFRDGVHPTLDNYARYVSALEGAGLVFDTSTTLDPTIADIQTTSSQSIANGDTHQIVYKQLPLTNKFVLTGKMDITVAAANPHIQFMFSAEKRFLVWDGDDWVGNGSMGLGWQVDGAYNNNDDDLYAYTQGVEFTVAFKLVVTERNAYFYFGRESGGQMQYTLNAVYVNIPSITALSYGTENVSAKLYDLAAKTALDDPTEYAALTSGTEFTTYENSSGECRVIDVA